jgi:hypothetical protein
MDARERYRQLIAALLAERASVPFAHGEIQSQTVIDPVGDHYLLMLVGWDRKRVHGCLVHVDIIDSKFWIQRDGTEDGIATELEATGVPREHIVLAFKSADIRKLTGYAVA